MGTRGKDPTNTNITPPTKRPEVVEVYAVRGFQRYVALTPKRRKSHRRCRAAFLSLYRMQVARHSRVRLRKRSLYNPTHHPIRCPDNQGHHRSLWLDTGSHIRKPLEAYHRTRPRRTLSPPTIPITTQTHVRVSKALLTGFSTGYASPVDTFTKILHENRVVIWSSSRVHYTSKPFSSAVLVLTLDQEPRWSWERLCRGYDRSPIHQHSRTCGYILSMVAGLICSNDTTRITGQKKKQGKIAKREYHNINDRAATREGPRLARRNREKRPARNARKGKQETTKQGQGKTTTNGQEGTTRKGQGGTTTNGQVGTTTNGQGGTTRKGQGGTTTNGQVGTTTNGQGGKAREGPPRTAKEGPPRTAREEPRGKTREGPQGNSRC
ncbi:hypothetical protein EDB19DRAFT_2026291 [Suillus lakei]|nr:hypothetical protein EDB19DRAFT_2026291 [Suillus lakei]